MLPALARHASSQAEGGGAFCPSSSCCLLLLQNPGDDLAGHLALLGRRATRRGARNPDPEQMELRDVEIPAGFCREACSEPRAWAGPECHKRLLRLREAIRPATLWLLLKTKRSLGFGCHLYCSSRHGTSPPAGILRLHESACQAPTTRCCGGAKNLTQESLTDL